MRKQFFSTELATFELLCKLQLNNSYCGTALHNNIQQEQKHHDKITIIIIHRAVMSSLLTLHNSPKKYWFAIDWTVHFKTAKFHSVPCPFNRALRTRIAGNSQIMLFWKAVERVRETNGITIFARLYFCPCWKASLDVFLSTEHTIIALESLFDIQPH